MTEHHLGSIKGEVAGLTKKILGVDGARDFREGFLLMAGECFTNGLFVFDPIQVCIHDRLTVARHVADITSDRLLRPFGDLPHLLRVRISVPMTLKHGFGVAVDITKVAMELFLFSFYLLLFILFLRASLRGVWIVTFLWLFLLRGQLGKIHQRLEGGR